MKAHDMDNVLVDELRRLTGHHVKLEKIQRTSSFHEWNVTIAGQCRKLRIYNQVLPGATLDMISAISLRPFISGYKLPVTHH